jgi:hypothetical protein
LLSSEFKKLLKGRGPKIFPESQTVFNFSAKENLNFSESYWNQYSFAHVCYVFFVVSVLGFVVVCLFFETGSHYVSQTGLEL